MEGKSWSPRVVFWPPDCLLTHIYTICKYVIKYFFQRSVCPFRGVFPIDLNSVFKGTYLKCIQLRGFFKAYENYNVVFAQGTRHILLPLPHPKLVHACFLGRWWGNLGPTSSPHRLTFQQWQTSHPGTERRPRWWHCRHWDPPQGCHKWHLCWLRSKPPHCQTRRGKDTNRANQTFLINNSFNNSRKKKNKMKRS